jgi:hypothetical protein
MRDAPINPIDSARYRIAEREIHKHCCGIQFEGTKSFTGHDLRLA